MPTTSITITHLRKLKAAAEPAVCVALYDANFARLAEAAGVEILLVGDSLGMTVQGHATTLPVTLDQMVYHTEAVARGAQRAMIISDLPFMTYATPTDACASAARLMRAGAHMVKLEGGAGLAPTLELLGQMGVPVCAHLGLTPQSVHRFGGYRVQARGAAGAALLADAAALAAAGAACLLLECVPEPLAAEVAAATRIPVIGIGAGARVDAQVLVVNDILGLTAKPPKFAQDFLATGGSVANALAQFVQAVKARTFPAPQHWFDA